MKINFHKFDLATNICKIVINFFVTLFPPHLHSISNCVGSEFVGSCATINCKQIPTVMQPMANLVFYGGSLCLSWSDIIFTTVVTVERCNFGGFFV